jgi:hypothetical protein
MCLSQRKERILVLFFVFEPLQSIFPVCIYDSRLKNKGKQAILTVAVTNPVTINLGSESDHHLLLPFFTLGSATKY